jgi:hypothetical protein
MTIIDILKTSSNFDTVIAKINNSIAGEAHSIADLAKMNNKKTAGDLWEEFCLYYLKTKYQEVYLWSDFPFDKYKQIPKITDHGIDIICVNNNNNLIAVQCKYRNRKTGVVTWRELSTFYSLALKLGCFKELIIMTSGKYVKYIKKLPNETSICYSSFNKLNSINFLEFLPEKIEPSPKNLETPTLEELRQLRLEFFNSL